MQEKLIFVVHHPVAETVMRMLQTGHGYHAGHHRYVHYVEAESGNEYDDEEYDEDGYEHIAK